MSPPQVSAIVVLSERHDEITAGYRRYRDALSASGRTFEVIYVLDGPYPDALSSLRELQRDGEPLRIVQLARWFGEATALSAGKAQATGALIVTLPAYEQIEPSEISKLIAASDEADMVVARRWPRIDSGVNRLQAALFNRTVNMLTATDFHDLGCGVRVIRREVIDEIALYGDQHRFLPLLAQGAGFRVIEVDARQSAADAHRRIYRPGVYLRRALDVLTVFFLVKFTRKPLRFFGLVGTSIAALGGIALAVIVAQRLLGFGGLANRPALLLTSLMIVLGIQLLALGLLGELIIYTHAREMKEYTIGAIYEHTAEAAQPGDESEQEATSPAVGSVEKALGDSRAAPT